MKLRKFDDFKRIYENNPALMSQPGDDELMMSTQTETKPFVREIPETKPERPIRREREKDPDKIEKPVVDPERKAYSEEMESDESDIDLMMSQLSIDLGSELRNNVIEYKTPNNIYKIEFFSDPMCFSINGKTMKFLTTAEEVKDYIETEEEQGGPAQAQSPIRPGQRFGAQSQRLPSGAQSQMANERKHNHSYKNRYR